PTNVGNLNAIAGTLTVDAGAGAANRLVISDLSSTAGNTNVVVTSSSITGFAPVTIFYSATGGNYTNGVTGDGILLKGSATVANTFNVRSTLQGSTTKIQTGQANDTFNVGNTSNSLADILGQLTLDGGSNTSTPITTLSQGSDSNSLAVGDTVTFNDQGDNT